MGSGWRRRRDADAGAPREGRSRRAGAWWRLGWGAGVSGEKPGWERQEPRPRRHPCGPAPEGAAPVASPARCSRRRRLLLPRGSWLPGPPSQLQRRACPRDTLASARDARAPHSCKVWGWSGMGWGRSPHGALHLSLLAGVEPELASSTRCKPVFQKGGIGRRGEKRIASCMLLPIPHPRTPSSPSGNAQLPCAWTCFRKGAMAPSLPSLSLPRIPGCS